MLPEHETIARELTAFVRSSYPAMKIIVATNDSDEGKLDITFIEEKFSLLYPMQRYHYLIHLIPKEYYEQKLVNTIWHELAPGEDPDEIEYPDEEMIESISQDVVQCLERASFFDKLDDVFLPKGFFKKKSHCYGDFRNSRKVLSECGFKQEELSDIFHVLMSKGGYCDCEILYNAVETSRLKSQYWQARARNEKPYDPHEGA